MGIEFPERRVVAMVTRSESVGAKPFGRTSFEFDAIDAETPIEMVDDAFSDPNYRKPFAAIRVVTTKTRFAALFDFVPTEGMWVELDLSPFVGRQLPLAFHSQLEEDGYSRYSTGRLSNARMLSAPGELPIDPMPMGASVPAVTTLARKLASKCAFPTSAIASDSQICWQILPLICADTIVVRDVGQASFVSFLSKILGGVELGHFDAGWPISFNGHTVPAAVPKLRRSAPVILSHWDWDHLHGYYKLEKLRKSPWITPVQVLGPGALKIATALDSKKLLFGCASTIHFGPIQLIVCTGSHPMNDTGLALVITLKSGKRALLVGDASYGSLGGAWSNIAYDLLVVTHHGAAFEGSAPYANGKHSPAVISVGKGNVYQHPRKSSLRAHRAALWKLQRTSSYGKIKRGDRALA